MAALLIFFEFLDRIGESFEFLETSKDSRVLGAFNFSPVSVKFNLHLFLTLNYESLGRTS